MSWIQHSSASCCAYCPVRLSSANCGYFSLSTCRDAKLCRADNPRVTRKLSVRCVAAVRTRLLANPRSQRTGQQPR